MSERGSDDGYARQLQLVAALRHPAHFGAGVCRVEVIETHVSWVLLTGPHAFKIKKAVVLPFLDGRALATRRHWCEEELRLNRRTAPGLYLDVVPIAGSVDAPVVGGCGEPIEYAVRMRQFAPSALLSEELSRGTVTVAEIDELALGIADLHRRIAVADPTAAFGTPAEILRFADDNFAAIGRGFAGPGESDSLQRLRAWTRDEFAARKAEFRRRRDGGFVRECHGDLHLANIARIDGRVTVFDCIEYNEHFRWIDVMSEVAFTVMDLDDRGQPALAWRLLNGYLEATGDYAGVPVLRFYLVYRAMVRAKVDCLRATQLADREARDASVADYRGYLALATRFAASPTPALFATHGVSGAGKTTFTQQLLEAIGGIRLRSDIERRRLTAGPCGPESSVWRPEDRYGESATAATYRRVAELARTVLAAGWPVIVDAACLAGWQRRLLRDLAHETGVPFVLLAFSAPVELLRERVRRRRLLARDASEADEAVLEAQLRSLEPLADDERASSVVIGSEAEALSPSSANFAAALSGLAPSMATRLAGAGNRDRARPGGG